MAFPRSIIQWWWETLGVGGSSHHGDRTSKDGMAGSGKLLQVIVITENGVDKVPF